MQREIQDAAYRYQQEVETRARIVVGVNEFVTETSAPAGLFRPDPAMEARQAERLADLRRRRDPDRAARALDAVDRAARGSDNLLASFLDAVRADVTLGEICARLRAVFGVHRGSVAF
jgi:methylmalonyl-CoA mutase N-terminal domain/subunit